MKKLKFVKSKLKVWNKGVFGDLRERKSTFTLDIERIDRLEQEGNLSQDLIALRNLRRKELGEVLLKKYIGDKVLELNGSKKGIATPSSFIEWKMARGKRNSLIF